MSQRNVPRQAPAPPPAPPEPESAATRWADDPDPSPHDKSTLRRVMLKHWLPATSEEAREIALECIGRAEGLAGVLAAYAWGGEARSRQELRSRSRCSMTFCISPTAS